MKTGNNVPDVPARHDVHPRDDSRRQLRDIEELVAKLRVVTKQLQFPAGSGGATGSGGAGSGGTATASAHPLVTGASLDEARRGEHADGGMN